VTGALHGNEVTGIGAAQEFVTADVEARLRGTAVAIPILNPAGVRTDDRNSYYHGDDPNRSFPYDVGHRTSPPAVQELINGRIFEHLSRTADALISLHEGWIEEELFTIVERVRYGSDRSRKSARRLADETVRLAEAFDLPIVREYDVDVQEEYGLQRSFECAAVNVAGVPAITPELGSPHIIEEENLTAAVTGIHNVMRALEMLPEEPEPNDNAPESPVDFAVKRVDGPVTDVAGIVRHCVEAGDPVRSGDEIAEITTPHGDVKTTIRTKEDGYILCRRHGVATYENDVLVSMATRDDGDLIYERP
jgi:predicted deacylase